MLALALFLPLVLTTLTVSWHNHDIRNIGLALLISWVISNACDVFLPFDYRIIVYPVLEVGVGMMAAGAWLVMRFTPELSKAEEGQLMAMLIVVTAMLSIAATINYAGPFTSGQGDKWLFVLLTNICFSIECILVSLWGVRDAIARATGIGRLFSRSRRASAPAATRDAGA